MLQEMRLLLRRGDFLRLAALCSCLLVNSLCELACLAALPAFISLLFAVGGMEGGGDGTLWWRVAETATRLANRVVDFPSTPQNMVVAAGVLLLALNAIRAVWMYLSLSLQERFMANRKLEISGRLLASSLLARAEFRMANSDASLVNRCVNDATQVVEDVLSPLVCIFNNAAVLLCLVVALMYFMPLMTVIAVGALALLGGGFTWLNRRRQDRFGRLAQQGRSVASEMAAEALGIADAARRQGKLKYYAGRFHEAMREMAMARRNHLVSNQIIWPYLEFASFAVMLLVMLFFLKRDAGGIAAVAPQMSMLAMSMVRLRTNSINLMSASATLRYGRPALAKVCAQLREAGEGHLDEADGAAPLSLRECLTLDGVSYRYPGQDGSPAVDGVSLRLHRGEMIGIAGKTGCGKTTLLRLMCGSIQPASGQIMVDGRPLEATAMDGWLRTAGYVPQEPFLLDADIDANVALGEAPADAAALASARADACIDDDIASGFARRSDALGERGGRLSGGQRQRIAIARAIYGGGTALFLDEATSALDNTVQEVLERSIREHCRRRGLAVAIVAHRLSTIRHCDRIVFMENGRITAVGDYSELLDKCPAFREMAQE